MAENLGLGEGVLIYDMVKAIPSDRTNERPSISILNQISNRDATRQSQIFLARSWRIKKYSDLDLRREENHRLS